MEDGREERTGRDMEREQVEERVGECGPHAVSWRWDAAWSARSRPQRRRARRIEASMQLTAPLANDRLVAARRRMCFAPISSHLRAALRATALLGVSLMAGTLLLPVARSARARRGIQRAWARTTSRLLGLRVHVDGVPPPAGSLLVANHLSYLDVVTLWCATSGSCVAKAEVAGWPLVGALGRIAGTLFIDRTRKRDILRVLPGIEHALRAGERVILFAEATSTRGDRVLPFKSPLFEAAVRTGRPVACASLHYETPPGEAPADLAVCWWGEMTFLDHVYALMRLPRFDATVRFAPATLRGGERKALARDAHEIVASIWTPVRGAR
jgi:1-acyl-sn-glycerol-3-phosphate acyltransferase